MRSLAAIHRYCDWCTWEVVSPPLKMGTVNCREIEFSFCSLRVGPMAPGKSMLGISGKISVEVCR